MKKLVLTLTAVAAAANLYAQGTVNFNNLSGTGVTGGSPVSNILTGARVPSGSTFLAQLYYGGANAAADSLVSVTNAPIGFASPGIFVGSTRTLLSDVVGVASPTAAAMATIQIRSWQATLGNSFESALARASAGGDADKVIGSSAAFQLVTGNPNAMPPGTPANLNGLRGFYLTPVPEPSTIGLGLVGLAALAFLRRRK